MPWRKNTHIIKILFLVINKWLCKIWGFHGDDYAGNHLLGSCTMYFWLEPIKVPVYYNRPIYSTSPTGSLVYSSSSEPSRLPGLPSCPPPSHSYHNLIHGSLEPNLPYHFPLSRPSLPAYYISWALLTPDHLQTPAHYILIAIHLPWWWRWYVPPKRRF
jgi:hypothetical protein